MMIHIIIELLGALSAWIFEASVDAERRRQAKRLLVRGREMLWAMRAKEADVQFGAALVLDSNVVRTLGGKERRELTFELGKSGDHGPNCHELRRQLKRTGPIPSGFEIEPVVLDDNIAVLKASGRLVMGRTQQLSSAIEEQIAHGRKRIVLDCSGLAYVDFSGVAEIIRGLVRVMEEGGRLCIVRGSQLHIFESVPWGHLKSYFYDSTDDALREL